MVAVLAVDAHEVREQIAALRVSCMMVQGSVVVQAVGATQVGSPGPTVQSVHVRSWTDMTASRAVVEEKR